MSVFFFFQAEAGIRDLTVTGVQTCALPISTRAAPALRVLRLRAGFRQGRGPRAGELPDHARLAGDLVACRVARRPRTAAPGSQIQLRLKRRSPRSIAIHHSSVYRKSETLLE